MRGTLSVIAFAIVALAAATALRSQTSGPASSSAPGNSPPSSANAPSGADSSVAQPADDWPDAPGKSQIFRTCNTACHTPDMLIGHNQDASAWSDTVYEMVQRGAQGSDEDFTAIVNYLGTYFGTAPDKVDINKATAMNLRNWLGIDEESADAIAAYRAKHGEFKSLDDLKKVSGLDAKYLDAVKGRLVF